VRRFRFYVPDSDGRPLTWPPPGPFWVSGWAYLGESEWTVVVAYAPSLEVLKDPKHWPDAVEIADFGEQPITFTDRFPKPEWWIQETPGGNLFAPLSAAELWTFGRYALCEADPASIFTHLVRKLVFTNQRAHQDVCGQTRYWFAAGETPAGGAS
jgi:hypothetical protein